MIISQYLLESSFCLLLFYGFYYFLLRQETFFQLNRVYLLLTPALSLMIPWLNIALPSEQITTEFGYIFPILTQADELQYLLSETLNEPTSAFKLTLSEILLGIYFLGAIFMFIQLLNNLWNIFSLIKTNDKSKSPEGTFVNTNISFPASSFFSYIFWNHGKVADNQQLIIEHEKVHIRQWHSLDVLFMELLVILKWFNPLIYLFKNALRVTHEFIADAYILKKVAPIDEYANALVAEVKKQQNGSVNLLTHTFHSLIKKRLLMMTQQKSKWTQAWKYLLSIPLMGALMLLFSFNLVEKLPGNQQLERFSQYLEDLGETTVFELNQAGHLPSHLTWGTQQFSLLTDSDIYKLKGVEEIQISLADLQNLLTDDFKIHYRGEVMAIEEQLFIYPSGDCVSTCQTVGGGRFCLDKIGHTLQDNVPFHIVFQLENKAICRAQFAIGQVPTAFNQQSLIDALGRGLEEVKKIDLSINDQDAKYQFQWGDFTFPLEKDLYNDNAFTGKVKITLEALRQLAEQIPTFVIEDAATPVQAFQFSIAQRPPRNYIPRELANWRDHRLESGMGELRQNFISYEKLETVADFVARGYPNLRFEFELMTPVEARSFGNISVEVIDRHGDWFPNISIAKTDASEGVFGFQLINRAGQKTVIKMDTTNAKYRWMYEQYRAGDKIEVVHIPDFQTVRRVLTLDDVVLPTNEIGKTTNLCEKETNALIYPEYHQLAETNISFRWRDVWGTQDQTVYDLDTFLASQKIEPELWVDEHQYDIVQWEMWVKPVIGKATHFITNTMQHPEIDPIIQNLESRTSIYFSNLLVRDENGQEILFPMPFVFNLQQNAKETITHVSEDIENSMNTYKKSDQPSYQFYWRTLKIELPAKEENSIGQLRQTAVRFNDFLKYAEQAPGLGINGDVSLGDIQFTLTQFRDGKELARCHIAYSENQPDQYKNNHDWQKILSNLQEEDALRLSDIKPLNITEEWMSDVEIYLLSSKNMARNEDLYYKITNGDPNQAPVHQTKNGHIIYQNYPLAKLIETAAGGWYKTYEFIGFEEAPVINLSIQYPKWLVYSQPIKRSLVYQRLRETFNFETDYSEDFPDLLTVTYINKQLAE